jgi:glutamine synthetase
MAKYKLEYIWLDGYQPVPNLRGKTQVKDFDSFPKLEQLPMWGFDGSSTRQAEGHSSECMLKPVASFPDSTKKNGVLVICEVMMPDGKTPHPTNGRATILDDPDAWFGFEQEYFLYKDGAPLGFPPGGGFPPPQGERISISAWMPGSITKASTPKSPRASGNSRSSARARRPPPTRCGWRGTS